MQVVKYRTISQTKAIVGIVVCCVLGFHARVLASANTAYEKGLELFNDELYEQSLEYLTKAAIAQPSDARIHYYIASAYARIGKHKEAKQEFFACYCLDPIGIAGKYSRDALRSYGEPVPGDKSSSLSANDKQVERAVSQIKRQAELQKRSHKDIANQGSLTAGRVGEEEAMRIRNAAYRRIYSRPSYLVPGDFFGQRDTEDPNVVMSRAEEGMRLARLSAKQRADQYEQWSKAQEKSVDEISANLESQLKRSKTKGGAQLRPEGTGFYVRFYGQQRSGPLPNIHPSVARISPFGTGEHDVPGESQQPTKSVKGDIIRR